MKILYLITKSNWGGAQKYVYDLATNLEKDKDNFSVSVACGGYGELYQKLIKENIKTYHITNLGRDINLFKELRVAIRLYKLLKEVQPDLIHLNSSKMGLLGAIIGRIARIKQIIFTAHGWPFREERNFLSLFFIKILSWLTIILSDKGICVSEKDYRDVKDWWFVNRNKLVMIHNGIIQDLRLKTQDKIQNASSDIGQNKIIQIVSIGELTKNKGFEYGLRAISLLKDEYKEFKYKILSFGGEERNNLLKLMLDLNLDYFVDLLICNEDHREYLSSADIYLLPSIKEGLPYVLLEAGLYGLPSVASDTGGVKEIIKNNQNGLLVETKDIYEMKEAILKLIKDRNLRYRLGEKAQENIINNFDLKEMINKTKQLY